MNENNKQTGMDDASKWPNKGMVCKCCQFYLKEHKAVMRWMILSGSGSKEHEKTETMYNQCTRYPSWVEVYGNHYCGEHKFCDEKEWALRKKEWGIFVPEPPKEKSEKNDPQT